MNIVWFPSSVIIDDLDIARPALTVRPLETDAPLLIDANGKLSGPISLERFVVPAFPITSRERRARRERVFFGEDDDALYRDLLASQCRKHGRAAFCLCAPPDPIHLVLVPDRKEALGEA